MTLSPVLYLPGLLPHVLKSGNVLCTLCTASHVCHVHKSLVQKAQLDRKYATFSQHFMRSGN